MACELHHRTSILNPPQLSLSLCLITPDTTVLGHYQDSRQVFCVCVCAVSTLSYRTWTGHLCPLPVSPCHCVLRVDDAGFALAMPVALSQPLPCQ